MRNVKRLLPVALTIFLFAVGEFVAYAEPLRSYTVIPSVVKKDGSEGFYIEVDAGKPVSKIELVNFMPLFNTTVTQPIVLNDSGQNGDRISADGVYTVGPFYFNPAYSLPQNLFNDANSPKGLYYLQVGDVKISYLDGSTSQFLESVKVGLINADLAVSDKLILNANLQITANIINLATTNHTTQRIIRANAQSEETRQFTKSIFNNLPDFFDFFALISTSRLEYLTPANANNYTIGMHINAQNPVQGLSIPVYDLTEQFGSKGKLLGLNALDIHDRGLLSRNLTHEMLHQWGALPSSLVIGDSSHYSVFSSVGSLIGGYKWDKNQNGDLIINCSVGRLGAYEASKLDLYLMGLINLDALDNLYLSDPNGVPPHKNCNNPVTNITHTLKPADIANELGQRIPDTQTSQKTFNIGFVVETHDRLLTDSELAFYTLLASHYTAELPQNAPTPYVGDNWVSIDRFFGGRAKFTAKTPFQTVVAQTTGPYQASTGKIISFNPAGSFSGFGNDLTYFWDFGDGQTSTAQSPSHSYALSGNYSVSLTVDDGVQRASVTTSANVSNDIPLVNFDVPSNIVLGESVQFDASGSVDPEGLPLSFLWDFGDGSTAEGPRVSHQYPKSGEYQVSVKVSDGEKTTTISKSLQVQNSPPVISVVVDQDVVVGGAVTFDASSTVDPDNHALNFRWQFPEGVELYTPMATYTFLTAGTVTVLLNVSDNDKTTVQAISVTVKEASSSSDTTVDTPMEEDNPLGNTDQNTVSNDTSEPESEATETDSAETPNSASPPEPKKLSGSWGILDLLLIGLCSAFARKCRASLQRQVRYVLELTA